MGKKIHIISFDIPFPSDYGGVIDVFYKLKCLAENGIDIILHCFQYGERMPQTELEKYCQEVFYYPRLIGWKGLDATLPYIVSSRRNSQLLSNLMKDDAPILFEGIHTTLYANLDGLADRVKLLRAHNVESDYYAELSKNSSHGFKKLYYAFESNRLKRYEQDLSCFTAILSISEKDVAIHQQLYPTVKHVLVPAFHANNSVQTLEGIGDYALYHGNLSVEENIRSVEYLAQQIFSSSQFKLIIAGKNPDTRIERLSGGNIELIANPTDLELHQLIQHAQVNVLPSFQQTGLKLKLLNALFLGRHCLLNHETENDLNSTVHIADSDNLFKQQLGDLMQRPFSSIDLDTRKHALANYQNAHSVQSILGLI